MFKKKGKNRIKIDFNISVISIGNFPKSYFGGEAFVELKRGKKPENCPRTQLVVSKESTVNFNEKFKIGCSFYQNDGNSKIEDKKELLLTVKYEKPSKDGKSKKEKKWKTLGKAIVPLQNYAEAGTIRHEILNLQTKEKDSKSKTRQPSLTVKIESNWVKVNDQKLKKVEEPKKEEGKPLTKENLSTLDTKTVQLGKETYQLEQDEVTESVASFSDGEEQVKFSDDEEETDNSHSHSDYQSKNGNPSKRELDEPVVIATTKSKEKTPVAPPPEDSDHEDPFDEPGGNIPESVMAELEDLRSDKSRLERKVERLQKDLDEKKKEIEQLKTSGRPASGSISGTNSNATNNTTNTPAKTSLDKSREERKINELQAKLDAELKEKSAMAAEISLLKQKLTRDSKDKVPTKKGTRANEVEMELEAQREAESKIRSELESLKKKYSKLQRENEERKILENSVFMCELQYDDSKEIPTNSYLLMEKLLAINAFDPIDEPFLGNMILSIRKTFSRSQNDKSSLTYWFQYTNSLFKLLKDEVGSQIMSFDDKSILTSPLPDNVDAMKPGPRFFYQLGNLVFEAFSKLLYSLYQPFEHLLTSYILEGTENLFDASQMRNRRKYNNDFPLLLMEVVKLLKTHFVTDKVTQTVLDQIFYFVDSQIFNMFLRQPQLFTCGRGFKIKMAISQIESSLNKQSASFANKQFNLTKEAANLLVMDKSLMSDKSLIGQIFSHLNVLQIKHIVERFKPDELSPEKPPEAVKSALKDLCLTKENSRLSLDLDVMDVKPTNLLL